MSKQILITGISGQVGSQLADFILENTDWDVIGMMRWNESIDNLRHLTTRINKKDRIILHYADLIDYASITRMINNHRPDYISHLAAQSFPKTSFDIPLETLQTNIMGTANILESVRQLKERDGYNPVIHVCSSSEVYGKASSVQEDGSEHLISESSVMHGASPYSISKIGTDYLGQFYGEAYNMKTFVTRMGTHTGARRSDVFFESTLAKQIALIEEGYQEPVLNLGNLDSIRTFQDARDAVRAYYLMILASEEGKIPNGDYFNIAGKEKFKLTEVVSLLIDMSTEEQIDVRIDPDRLRPIDADYQLFSCDKLKQVIDWEPEISTREMFFNLLEYWRAEISQGRIPLSR